jgi:hypothetical protein
MAITPLPTPPSRDDPTNFATRADAFLGALPDFATEANDLADDVNDDAVAAAASASTATTQAGLAQTAANAAAATAGASLWVSGTTYNEGVVVWSPINSFTYRRITNGAGTTDPSADPTNWKQLSGTGDVSQTGTQTLSNKTFLNAKEKITVSATAATGTIAYDVATQSVLYYTTNASGNFTVNIRGSSSVTLNSLMAIGESYTVAFLNTNGGTAYYNNVVQVDGTTSGVTTKWQNAAPTAGNASSIDSYVYTVIKTADAVFTVIASQTKFA